MLATGRPQQQVHERAYTERQQQPGDEGTNTVSTSNIGSSPKCFVIVYNVAKKHNIGTLLRSCTAFGVAQGQGLSEKQMRLCDAFVYIPQYGAGTASLNVTVAASIILHHFALWAGYAERGREGAKYVVAERPQRTSARGVVPLTAEERAALQKARASALEDGREWMEDAMGCGGGLDGVLEALAAEGVDGGVVGPMIQGGG
ncbi:hypothetical protein MNEG_3846 [Monoraphidium neglectum]|uniref:tRNA/rRNA methyltransferase SpoU type domain-containing protein n=1 Tax=Monoraphidium neglectum TaxID=145388 RepID=A0A0D2NGF3_9CHLO|nr:hypothetical protein MNEG_3846 [Monoraphidium neglectum]KIZ04106.1 hypothetical protein MNEG_3846 [Monoraphidium neglectum]|eukprot:XP_013903125.1 hypothetical protein MNEG_3846 [Monoraphidium neglectum]